MDWARLTGLLGFPFSYFGGLGHMFFCCFSFILLFTPTTSTVINPQFPSFSTFLCLFPFSLSGVVFSFSCSFSFLFFFAFSGLAWSIARVLARRMGGWG